MSSARRSRAARSRSPHSGTRTILTSISGSIAHGESDYAIFGGEDHKTGQARNTETCFRKVEQALLKLAPEAKIEHRWSGQVIEAADGLPYIGPNEDDQFIATAYCGNGYTFGSHRGRHGAGLDHRREESVAAICSVRTGKRFAAGTWDYLRENKDYPYYLIQDRFRSPEGKSLSAVKRGEGKILKFGRKKVAVYRDERGNVKKMSAVCTHMGCLVRWNQAESTWDCPCHGSRFGPRGNVLAGPAETPLARVRSSIARKPESLRAIGNPEEDPIDAAAQ